jgi:glycosyltransferase involved in cell wall biosynthesis
MRILLVVDSKGWAIDHLAQVKVKYNQHINFKVIYLHPRDIQDDTPEASDRLELFEHEVKEFEPDIIHFEYFRTAGILMNKLPFLTQYKTILTHHNQKQKVLKQENWIMQGITYLVTHTQKARKYLIEKCEQPRERVFQIRHGIDLTEFTYSNEEPEEPRVGYVGRIVPWKGLKEIALACKELRYKILFMGKQDKPAYWDEILKEGLEDVFDFSYYNCPDEERKNAYRNMTIYVGNSEDWYEEGTLPYLEAMASGVPVVTTLNGVADELAKDQENSLVVNFKDYVGLKYQIKKLMEDKELRQKLRSNAWDTVKNLPEQKMALEYGKLYYKLHFESSPIVSVIIPIRDRVEQLEKILDSLKLQTYKNFEVIICDDNSKLLKVEDSNLGKNTSLGLSVIHNLVLKSKNKYNFPIKYINTHCEGYGLAKARNMGVIEAQGELLLFCDSRLKPDENAIKEFVNEYKKNPELKKWYFGNKSTGKVSFVENFSAINREHFITFGMFNEEIDKYGGMSQEVRTRWYLQGGEFEYIDTARAEQLMKATKDSKRRQDIIDMKFKLYKMYNERN